MAFSEENGYVPVSFETIMIAVMDGINTQFNISPAYTYETFVGTSFYKNAYAIVQRMQENEVKTSEIFLKLQQYFAITNEAISRPVATNPGLIEAFSDAGFIASVKPTIEADAGKLYVCVQLDDEDPDYAEDKLEACNIIKDSSAAGVVSMGTEVESIVLSNGQSFDFKFNLPAVTEPLLRLTLTLSENNMLVIDSPENVKQTLLENIAARYRLGKNFEPQRYFNQADAPWTSQVLLEYSVNGGGDWLSTVFDAAYDDLFDILLENITVVEE